MEYKYLQIKSDIIKEINSSTLTANEKLPSQSKLQSMYNTSRITIIRVLNELEKEGYIFSKPGRKGMYIKSKFLTNSKYILVILGDITSHYDSNLLKGIEDQLDSYGYKTIICNSNRNSDKIQSFLQNQDFSTVDGVILIPAIETNFEKNNRKIIDFFMEKNINYVLIDQQLSGINSNIIKTDHKTSSFKLVNSLLNEGHTNILIGGGLLCYSIHERIQGVVNAYTYNNVDFKYSQIISINDSHYPMDENHYKQEFETLKKEILAAGEFDAFFALNNRILNIFIKAMISLDMDISKVKICLQNELNKPVPPYTDHITYIDPHLTKMGRTAAKLLINNITNSEDEVFISQIIQSTILER
jgi:DNA-binding LacI/PurR family transcriptional regulator